jgi:vancomycin resistance protein VanJ
MAAPAPPTLPYRRPRSAIALLVISLLLLLFVATVYAIRTATFAALTQLPTWVWPLPGLFFTIDAYRKRELRRAAGIVTLAWGLFALFFVDELPSLFRSVVPASVQNPALRVVTLNCAGGSEAAADEVAAYRPDIVLLQESPPAAFLPELAKRLYGDKGGTVVGMDASIVARGNIEAIPIPASLRLHCAAARVRVPGFPEVQVVSLRLNPPVARIDVWNPENWRIQAEDYRRRHETVAEIVAFLATLPRDSPVLVGGDWNAPARDGSLAPLASAGLRDTFRIAGRGCGNTITNEMPFHRIDQLWTDPARLRPRSVTAHRTENSDHRLVAATFVFPAK